MSAVRGVFVHEPMVPRRLQALQAPVQVLLQQTPLAQMPEAHAEGPLQDEPSMRRAPLSDLPVSIGVSGDLASKNLASVASRLAVSTSMLVGRAWSGTGATSLGAAG